MRKRSKIGVKTQGVFSTLEIRRRISMTVPHQSYYELKKETNLGKRRLRYHIYQEEAMGIPESTIGKVLSEEQPH